MEFFELIPDIFESTKLVKILGTEYIDLISIISRVKV